MSAMVFNMRALFALLLLCSIAHADTFNSSKYQIDNEGEQFESDDERTFCYDYHGKKKCFEINQERLTELKGCGFIKSRVYRNRCANELVDPWHDHYYKRSAYKL